MVHEVRCRHLNTHSRVPDSNPDQLQGNFSGLLALSSKYQIYDRATTTPAANGRFSRQPFAGNLVPQARFSPIAVAAAKHFTKAKATETADGTNNFVKAATWILMTSSTTPPASITT